MFLNNFEEFKYKVTKSGIRMKIKSVIQKQCGGQSPAIQLGPIKDVPTQLQVLLYN